MSAHEVKIKVGVNSSSVKTGLNAVRHQFHELREFINSDLGTGLSIAGLYEGLEGTMEKAAKIAQLSERFGVGAEGLQKFGNAAEQHGSSMDAVAGAMNKMIVNQRKVREGNEDMRQSLEDLKIDAAAFINLAPEEAFLKIADGVAHAEDHGKAYAAVVNLMGRSAGELINTLKLGSDGIDQLNSSMMLMSAEAVEQLHHTEQQLKAAKSSAMAAGAEMLMWVINAYKTIVLGAFAVVSLTGSLFKNMGKGWGANFQAEMKAQQSTVNEMFKDIWHPAKEGHGEAWGADGELSESGGESKSKGNELTSLQERLAEIQRKARDEELTGQTKINALIEQRAAALAKLNFVDRDAAKANLDAQIKAAEIDNEIHAERKKIDEEHQRKAEAAARAREENEKKQFKRDLEGLSPDDQRAALQARIQLAQLRGNGADDEEKAKLEGEIDDYQEMLAKVGTKDQKSGTTVADRLTKIGLGGGAFYVNANDPAKKSADALAKIKADTEKSRHLLEEIEKKQALWNP